MDVAFDKLTSSTFSVFHATEKEFLEQVHATKPAGNMHFRIPGYGPAAVSLSYTTAYRSEDGRVTDVIKDSFHLYRW